MPHRTTPHARLLAWWSFGIAHPRSGGRRTVATFLAMVLRLKVANIEQGLSAWCLAAPDKAGRKRQRLEVTTCWVPLLTWIIRWWPGTQLALTVDARSRNDRLVVRAVSVVYRGIGIPVAWTIRPAGQPRAWRRAWVRLLRQVRPAIPRDWTVIVLADRGVYARWRLRRIVRLGGHPCVRINTAAKFRPAGQARWYWRRELVGTVEERWPGRGTAGAAPEGHGDGTLVAGWGAGSTDPWDVLTDREPDGGAGEWDGLRRWCAQGFTCTTRGGWQWQPPQVSDPRRAERGWVARAVALLWMVRVGTALELAPPDDQVDLPDRSVLLGRAGRPRRIRLFRLGWLWRLAQAVGAQPLPLPQWLVPDPWPLQARPAERGRLQPEGISDAPV